MVAATLDGVNNFTVLGDTYVWDDSFIQYVSVNGPDLPSTEQVNLTLAGNNWSVRVLEFNGNGLTGSIVDTAGATGNRIHLLRLGDGPTDVTLINTRVRYIEAQSNTASNITLGSQSVNMIDMQDGNTTINGGTGFIGSIRTGSGNDTVTLQSGAEQISLGSGDNSITTGAGYVGSILMYSENADVNTITIGTGGVRSIGVSHGRDRVTLQNGANVEQMQLGANNDTLVLRGDSSVGQAMLGDGNNVVSVGAGHIDSVLSFQGNDTFTVGSGGIEMLNMGDGNNRLTVGAGGFANVVRGDNGNDIVTLNGDARILMLKLDGGNNVLTTANGNVESYYSFGGTNTLNIGAGGIQQVVLSGAAGLQTVVTDGWLGSLQCYQSAINLTTGAGGATMIYTSSLADTITTGTGRVNLLGTYGGDDHVTTGSGKVDAISTGDGVDIVSIGSGGADAIDLGDGNDQITTGIGYVQLINTGNGNNLVTLGTGGTGFVRGGDGDDVVRLNTMNPFWGVILQGEGGNNTADFSQIGVAITVSFDRYDYQSIGDLTGADNPSIGYFNFVSFHNMVGTGFGDRLEGNDDANRLSGANGNDTLSGLAGADTMIGGRGNDSLTGGADVDVFVFSAGGGRDRVTDFVELTDKIQFTNAASLASIAFAQSGAHVLLTVGTTEVLVLNSTVAEMNNAANFLF